MQEKRIIGAPSESMYAAFDPLNLEKPFEIEKAKINHGLDVGPIVRADRLVVSEVALPITLKGADNLIRIADILDDLMRLLKASAYRKTLSESITFELERRKVTASLLAELHDEVKACKKVGLSIFYSCSPEMIEVQNEWGNELKEGWIASLFVEPTYKN